MCQILQKIIILVGVTFLLQVQGSLQLKGGTNKGIWNIFGLQRTCNCRCGVPNREARFLGGEYLKGHEFPWLVMVNIRSTINIGGVLINDRYILTAAGPLLGISPYEVKVIVGLYDRCIPDISSSNVSVENIIIHPDFSPSTRSHDVALLRLNNIVPFERRVNPICLPKSGATYLGQLGTVIGWSQGLTLDGEVLATCRPRKTALPILNGECSSSSLDLSLQDQGCLGVIGALSVLCKTDAGAPVQYRSYNGVYELIGILNDVNECNNQPSTALFTRINYHLDWIKDTTREACYCKKIY